MRGLFEDKGHTVKRRDLLGLATVCALGVSLFSGCGAPARVEIVYERPAGCELPPGIRRIVFAGLSRKTVRDARWADLATEKLTARLDEYNKQYRRYELRDRRAAIADAPAAVRLGRLAGADAVIYGSVTVMTRDETGVRQITEAASGSAGASTEQHTRRCCLANITVNVTDVNTGETLMAWSFSADYDSHEDGKREFGIGGTGCADDDVAPAELVLERLIAHAVEKFAARIIPRRDVVTETLQKVRSASARRGNKLAADGDYAAALAEYAQGVESQPADHGALFNAGLMCEVLKDLDGAEEFYAGALGIEDKPNYAAALSRVRSESAKDGE